VSTFVIMQLGLAYAAEPIDVHRAWVPTCAHALQEGAGSDCRGPRKHLGLGSVRVLSVNGEAVQDGASAALTEATGVAERCELELAMAEPVTLQLVGEVPDPIDASAGEVTRAQVAGWLMDPSHAVMDEDILAIDGRTTGVRCSAAMDEVAAGDAADLTVRHQGSERAWSVTGEPLPAVPEIRLTPRFTLSGLLRPMLDPSRDGVRALLHRGSDGDYDGYRLSSLGRYAPLSQIGVKNGDVLMAIDGHKITGVMDAEAAKAALSEEALDDVTLTLQRGSGAKREMVELVVPLAR